MKKITSLLLSLCLAFSLSVPAFASEKTLQKVNQYTPGQFTDVPDTLWCASNVQSVYEYGLMNGVSDSYFSVNGELTVIQSIVMACRIHANYYGNAIDTTDASVWYQPYVDYAKAHKLVWEADGAYNSPARRETFVTIFSYAMPMEALKAINDVEDGAIPDVAVSAAYAQSVYRFYRAGILTGNDAKGTFGPQTTITRGAAAAIISRMADPSLRKSFTLHQQPFEPVPISQLANYKSLKKSMTDSEFQAAYDAARKIIEPLAKKDRTEQLKGIASALRDMVDSGKVAYTTSEPHYNDPYGFFVSGVASCAGCTRATGLCLNMLGIPYEHVNENQYTHQWCRVDMGGGVYWICDAYGLYCGPESAPYLHPNFPNA